MIRLPRSESIFKSITRTYATHSSISPTSISTHQSSNGLKVLSTSDQSKLTASISVFIKAGSRHQTLPGLSHVLKNLVFKSTQKRSALSVVREAELLGGVLTSTLTREHLILNAEFIKGNEGFFAELLGDVLSCSKFLPHEFNEEVIPGVISDYHQAQLDPNVKAMDLAHQLAYRRGLGHSLFATPHPQISHRSAVEFALQSFAQSSQNLVIGTGLESDSLVELVNQFFKPTTSTTSTTTTSPSTTEKSKYYGGEIRLSAVEGSHGKDTFLIAFEGGDHSTKPEFTILQHLLGSSPNLVKWSNGTTPIASLPLKSFHLPYSDSGLFGFLVNTSSDQVKSVTNQALSELKKIASGDGVDEESVKRSVKKAQFLVASGLESNIIKAETIGSQNWYLTPTITRRLCFILTSQTRCCDQSNCFFFIFLFIDHGP
ncbi:Metalloenzyme, LuxS/M16 peptidase-like protein [Melampsora americana]|nr:Metalloenzyme, LuxS/M16 peptidase-like protein [Melampsora americana]